MAYALLLTLLCINLTVGYFGAKIGYTVNGVARGFDATSDMVAAGGQVGHDFVYYLTFGIVDQVSWDDWWQEPINDALAFCGDNLGFLWDMSTFQVDGMPQVLNLVFVAMNLLTVFLAIRMIRGVS